jgi:phage regulator Rha-like protein
MVEVEMTSLEIAELTGKEHRRVRQDIKEKLLQEISLHESVQSVLSVNTSTYKNERGREYEVYVLNRYAVNALLSTYSMEHAVKLVMHIHKLEMENFKLQEENRKLNDMIAQTFKDKAWVAQEFGAKAAGIEHPRKFVEFIKSNSKAYEWMMKKGYFDHRRVGKKTTDKAYMWSQAGFQYLVQSKDKLNERTKELMKLQKLNILPF